MEKEQIIPNELLSKIMDDYFKTFDINPVEVEINITNDMNDSYADLRPDHIEKDPNMLLEKNTSNGMTVPPKDIDDKFTILLNKYNVLEYKRNNDVTWIGTIAHEITHVIDFMNYAKIIRANSFDEIVIKGDITFQLWTEFNARAKGYYFLRKYAIDNSNLNIKEHIEWVINNELPYHMEMTLNSYNSTNNEFEKAYHIVQYLGRLYTLQQFFPNYIDDDFIEENLISYKLMYDFYKFFAKNANLDDAYKHFDELECLMIQYFGLFAN